MLFGLDLESFCQSFGHIGQGNIGATESQPARLQAGGIQQVVDHSGQSVCFLFDDGQAVADGGPVPLGVIAAQRGGVAFDAYAVRG